MAEIRVEKRKKPMWPWILGLLGVVLLAFVILNNSNDREDKNMVVNTESGNHEGAAGGKANSEKNNITTTGNEVTGLACIDRFSGFIQEHSAKKMEGPDHEYSHAGLKYLSCSLESLLEKNDINDSDLDKRQEKLSQTAEALQANSESDEHPKMIKDAFKESVDIMEALQRKNYPGLKDQISQIKKVAKDIEVDQSTHEQKEKLDSFFNKANQVVVAMRDQSK